MTGWILFCVAYAVVLFGAAQLGLWIARSIVARRELREIHARSIANLFPDHR